MSGQKQSLDWSSYLFPEPVTDLSEVKQRLTDHPAIQAWFPEASLAAVSGIEALDEAAMSMHAYGNLMADFEDRFPELIRTVREATAGCGRAVVNWRPTDPQYTTVSVDFRTEREIQVMFRCTDGSCSVNDLADFLNRLSQKLPQGTPFPRRPDVAAGVIVRDEGCIFIDLVVDNTGRQIERYGLMRFPGKDQAQKIPGNAVMERLEAILFPE